MAEQNDLVERVVKSVTDDFCESFNAAEDYTGFTAHMVARGLLPECVNPQDARVMEIVRKCQEVAGRT